jgi:hypothetical protein
MRRLLVGSQLQVLKKQSKVEAAFMLSTDVRQVLEDIRHHLAVTNGMRATTSPKVIAGARRPRGGEEELTSVLHQSDYIRDIDAALKRSSELSPGVIVLLARLKGYLATIDGATVIEAGAIDEKANPGGYFALNHREYLDAIDKEIVANDGETGWDNVSKQPIPPRS